MAALTNRDDVLRNCRPPSEVPFPSEEYRSRLARIRERMSRDGMATLLITAPEGMNYIGGYQCEWYQGQSPRQWPASSAIAVTVDSDRYIHFDTEREAVLTRYCSIAEDIRIFPPTSMRDGVGFIASELKSEGWLDGKVGIEMHSYRPNRLISHRFEDALKAAGAREVVDGTDVMREVRWIKSPLEMQCIEEAGRIADIGMKAAIAELRPGVMETEVVGAMMYAMTKAGGEFPAIYQPVLSGQKTNAPHSISTRKKIERGELVLVDLSGVVKRYHANLARTFSMGEPGKDVKALSDKATDSLKILRKLLRPGLPVRELNETMKRYYEEQDIWKERGWIGGYEMGIAFPPDWVGPFVYDPLSDINADRVFDANTAVNYENQFFMPRHEGMLFQIDTLAFFEKDAHILSQIPPELTVIE
jgi:Xaa-Pro aminopeptidase